MFRIIILFCGWLSFIFANRIIPKLIGYYFIKRFNTQIQFGRVSLPFTLRDVKIIKNGFSIVSFSLWKFNVKCCQWNVYVWQQIDEITIRSSFLNSEVSKLLSITIRDIRVNKDINDVAVIESNASGQTNDDDFFDQKLNVCDFRDKKVPPIIIKFAQVCKN